MDIKFLMCRITKSTSMYVHLITSRELLKTIPSKEMIFI